MTFEEWFEKRYNYIAENRHINKLKSKSRDAWIEARKGYIKFDDVIEILRKDYVNIPLAVYNSLVELMEKK